MLNLLSYQMFQHAFIVGILLGILLPTVGIVVLLRRMTFIADSFGHINMAGIAFAIFISSIIPLAAGLQSAITIIWTICAAVIIEYLRERYRNYKELSITIVYSISIALMMIFMSLSGGYNSSLFSILFGNINGISQSQVITMVNTSVIILTLVGILYKKILLVSLEEEYARLYGINVTFIKYLTMIVIAVTITIAISAIGVLLVSSLITIPLLASGNIAKNLKQTYFISIAFTEISIILGILASYYLNLPTSGIIVLIAIIIYFISIKFKTE